MNCKTFFFSAALALSTLVLSSYTFPEIKQNGKIAVVAHRGFWKCDAAGNSQNSIAALKAAQDNKFWGSEFDVQLTKDSVVVVNHDPKIQGKSIIEHNFSDFSDVRLPNGEGIPTLDEYLKQGAKSKKTILVLELKEQPTRAAEDLLLSKTIESLKANKLYNPTRVIFITFSRYMSKRLAEICPQFINQFLTSDDVDPSEVKADGINGIDYYYKVFQRNNAWTSNARVFGMSSNAWTVDKEEDIREMIDLKVDAITTNEPLKVRQILGSQEFHKKK